MSDLEETTPLGPVTERERIAALDVLRGFAILGIFMVNIQFFAMPISDLLVPSLDAATTPSELLVWRIVKVFFEYKFISLFSLLFGMGMVVQLQRAQVRGRPFYPMYVRRTLVLMAIGLVHALLLWYGDILFFYSIVAMAVMWLAGKKPRLLVSLGIGSVMLAVVWTSCLSTGGYILQTAGAPETTEASEEAETPAPVEEETEAEEPPDTAETPGTPVVEETDPVQRIRQLFETGDFQDIDWSEVETIAYRDGPYWLATILRAATFGIIMLMLSLGGFFFRIAGMFLLGAGLMKLQFFDARHRRWHVLLAVVGIPVGIAGEAGAVMVLPIGMENISWHLLVYDPLHQVFSFTLCLGYVGLVTLLAAWRPFAWAARAIGAVGRMALTNYLTQTVVATSLMYGYGWGLGWFGDVSRPRQVALVAAIYSGQIIVSILWLQLFRFGPVEWLWRSLTYMKLQPLRRP